MAHTDTLRTLIQAPDLLVMPGIFDGFSARLVEHAGFSAGLISGGGLSETLLGYSDVGLMGFELNLAAVTRLAACCTIPLLADADTGYGNAVNVYHTTRAFEQAGVAGLMIEDQTWPKRCGHMQGKEVIPAEEMVKKIHAACDARRDPAFVIKARTDAFATHGLPEVLRRLTLYAEAGADLLFADALVSEPDIATVARHVPKPLCVNMGFGIRTRATTPLIAPAQLQALGVAVVIYPRLLTACAIQGMKHGIAALRDAMQSPTVLERPELDVSFGEVLRLIAQEGATIINGFDPHFHALTTHPDCEKTDRGRLRIALFPTGMASSEPAARRTQRLLCPTVTGWGMTEIGCGITRSSLDSPEDDRCLASGYALPGYACKVIDQATGETVPCGTLGELCVRGYSLMQGYYKKPEETAAVVDAEGWLHTGDVVTMREDGTIRFLGWYKDLLKVGGENVDPIEVEGFLLRHPAIDQVQIIGVPDPRLSEVPCACIVPKPGEEVTHEALVAFCRGELASFKIPQYTVVVDGFPMTSSGKVQKFKLREMAAESLGLGQDRTAISLPGR